MGFAAFCGLLGGCAAPGGPVSNPVGRTLSWYSYVGGEDIRAGCVAGSRDMLRFVYNGRYTEQLRTYDVVTDVVSPGAIFKARVNGRSSLTSFDLSDPLSTWKGTIYQHFLSPDERDGLVQALAASGFNRPAPKGLNLRSDWFYWTVSACRNGSFHFYAWQQPDDDLSQLAFIPALLALDKTGADFNAPRPVNIGPFDPTSRAGNVSFLLTVSENGLVHGPTF